MAQILRTQALRHRPRVVAALRRVTKHAGSLVGLENAIKDVFGIEDKIRRLVAWSGGRRTAEEVAQSITDVLRFTMEFDTSSYADGVRAAIDLLERDGFFVYELDNRWTSPMGGTYRGINVVVRDPAGYLFELQFHTTESFQVKQHENHTLYEERRRPGCSPDRAQELDIAMAEQWANVPTPDGVAEIPSRSRVDT
jgi:hypothetical protein